MQIEITNFIELNPLYTTQLTVVILQLVMPATCFGLVWPSSGLQRLVSIKVHNVAVPMGYHYVPQLIITFVSLMIAKQSRNMLLI